jgi:uncharacterized delta-60 repeat protein
MSRRRARLAFARLEDRLAPTASVVDYTFGTDGRTALPDGTWSGSSFINTLYMDVAPAAGDKLVVVTFQRTEGEFSVSRLTADGAPDPTFGTGGTTAFGFDVLGPNPPYPAEGADLPRQVAAMPDGRVVVAGIVERDTVFIPHVGPNVVFGVGIARLTADGKLDPSFDGDGKAVLPLHVVWGEASVIDLAATPDGAVMVVVDPVGGGPRYEVYRLTADGKPDTTAGPGGRVTLATTGRVDTHRVDPAGRIHAGIEVPAAAPGQVDVYAARFTPDGQYDPTFGTGGKTLLQAGLKYGNVERIQVFPDGSAIYTLPILVPGPGGATFWLRPDGTLNTEFGVNGRLGRALPDQLAPQPGSRLVALWDVDTVVRYTPAGDPDPTWGPGGLADTKDLGYLVYALWPGPGETVITEGYALTVPGKPNVVVLSSPGVLVSRLRAGPQELPTISAIPDQVLLADSPAAPVPFTVADAETPPGQLTFTVTSSDEALLPAAGVVIGGAGADRTLTLVPAPGATGTATVTVTVRDAESAPATATFTVRVNAPPVITPVADVTATVGQPIGLIPFGVGDSDTAAAFLDVTAVSSNPDLVPPAGLAVSGAGPDRTLAITPTAGATGMTAITIYARDPEGLIATEWFVLTIVPPNAPPTISDMPDVTATAGEMVGPFAFTVADAETPAAGLVVTAASSNTALVPVGGIVLGGTGTARSVTITPAAGKAGTAVVTLTVRDAGGLTDTDSFTVTVNLPPPPLPVPPTISGVADVTATAGEVIGPITFAVADAETPAAGLVVTAASGNPALIPAGGIALGGAGGSRTVTITPAAGETGTATIILTVRDAAGLTATEAFTVTVTARPAARDPVLVGFPQFAAGADRGAGTVTHYDPDGSARFTTEPFGSFTGGVRTAAADFNADGVADLVVGTGPGTATRVFVLDGRSQAEIFGVDPFEAAFTGGVFVAAGDLTGDGVPDLVITPDEGGGPRVRAFDGNASFGLVADFFGIEDPNFRGGARAAIADVNADGAGDLIVAAGFGGGPRVAGFSGKSLATGPVKIFGDFFMFEQTLRNGVFITAGDIDGDAFADVIAGGGPGGGPRVFALSGKGLVNGDQQVQLANFFGGDEANRGGIRVAVKDLDADTKADLVAGAGAGSRVTAYPGKSIAPEGTPPTAFDFDAFPGFAGGVFVG